MQLMRLHSSRGHVKSVRNPSATRVYTPASRDFLTSPTHSKVIVYTLTMIRIGGEVQRRGCRPLSLQR